MEPTQPIRIHQEHSSEREQVLELLRQSGLPVEDIVYGCHIHFLVAENEGSVAGCIGVEFASGHALIRSLAVRTANRGAGIGGRLLEAAESLCRQRGVRDSFLLTLTAEPFFARRGYQRIERDGAPDDIAATTEFASLCPVSSAFMTKRL
jgi:amino-acid N-acetyltransferase